MAFSEPLAIVIASLLLQYGADFNGGKTPYIIIAIITKDLALVELALARGADVNSRPSKIFIGSTPLRKRTVTKELAPPLLYIT